MNCPFCGLDPYEYVSVDVGISIPIAVNCCGWGVALFQYDRDYNELRDEYFHETGRYPKFHNYEWGAYDPASDDDDWYGYYEFPGEDGIGDQGLLSFDQLVDTIHRRMAI